MNALHRLEFLVEERPPNATQLLAASPSWAAQGRHEQPCDRQAREGPADAEAGDRQESLVGERAPRGTQVLAPSASGAAEGRYERPRGRQAQSGRAQV